MWGSGIKIVKLCGLKVFWYQAATVSHEVKNVEKLSNKKFNGILVYQSPWNLKPGLLAWNPFVMDSHLKSNKKNK